MRVEDVKFFSSQRDSRVFYFNLRCFCLRAEMVIFIVFFFPFFLLRRYVASIREQTRCEQRNFNFDVLDRQIIIYQVSSYLSLFVHGV